MKKLALILCLPLLLTGCATTTTSIKPDDVTAYITAHAEVLGKAVAAVSKFCLAQAEKDPYAREQLKADINQIVEKVARGLDAATATAGGTLTPAQLAADLKVRDPSVQAFLDGAVILYGEGYKKLEASGKATETIAWAKLVLSGLKVLAAGLNQATQ